MRHLIYTYWDKFPKWLKITLYKLASFYDECIKLEVDCIYDIVSEIYLQAEQDSPWLQQQLLEAIEESKKGMRVSMTVEELKEWLDEMLVELEEDND